MGTVVVDIAAIREGEASIINAIRSMAHDQKIAVITNGSGEEHYEGARDWLDGHAVPYDELHSRLQGDSRPTPEFKQGVLQYLKSRGHRITLAIECANPVDALMWQANGVRCLSLTAN